MWLLDYYVNSLALELEARLNAGDLEGQSVRVEQLQQQSRGIKQRARKIRGEDGNWQTR